MWDPEFHFKDEDIVHASMKMEEKITKNKKGNACVRQFGPYPVLALEYWGQSLIVREDL